MAQLTNKTVQGVGSDFLLADAIPPNVLQGKTFLSSESKEM